eukprot:2813958-Prymnesium_polylepis.2
MSSSSGAACIARSLLSRVDLGRAEAGTRHGGRTKPTSAQTTVGANIVEASHQWCHVPYQLSSARAKWREPHT